MKLPHLFLSLVLSFSLTSCLTSSKPKEAPPLMSQKMANRMMKPDMKRRSLYDKEMKATFDTKKGGTNALSRKKFGAQEYGGNKSYSHTPKFHTNDYTSGKDKSKFHTGTYAQSNKKPAFADQTFSTKKSWFGKHTSRDAGKTFSGATDTYKTTANRDALKSQQKNDRPQVIELERNSKAPAYSEDQVKKIMGRD